MGLSMSSTGRKAADSFEKHFQKDGITVALMGNPNVGKSTLFNHLTGMHQHTGNWPGKTVTGAVGKCTYKNKNITLVDLPGCYSLSSHSPEEEVARDFITSKNADITVVICDATALERNLILVLKTLEVSKKTVLCINLMDEARKKGITINKKEIEKELNIPVVMMSARNGKGTKELLDTILYLYENEEQKSPEVEEITQTVKRAENIAKKVTKFHKKDHFARDRKIDKILCGYFSFPIMALGLMGIFWLTITGANYVSDFLAGILFKTEEWLYQGLMLTGCPEKFCNFLILGGYRMLIWVVSVMLPPMAIFFPLFTLLEDAGVLPRIAFNLDRCFKCCGACGKQALTMCMGFGCNAAGVIGARIIDSKRERLIAIITNSFVPCNGRFPALIAIITIFFVTGANILPQTIFTAIILTVVIGLGVAMTFLASKILHKTVLSGETTSFTLELPPYRRPQITKVIVRSVFDRTLFVLGRAALTSFPAGLLIFLMANISIDGTTLFSMLAEFLSPIGNIMGLDGVIILAFILGFPANETVIPIMIMGYLSQSVLTDATGTEMLRQVFMANGWDIVTAINTVIFFLFHWPCATTLITIYKETKSMKWTALSFILPTLIGFLLCTVVNLTCNLLA